MMPLPPADRNARETAEDQEARLNDTLCKQLVEEFTTFTERMKDIVEALHMAGIPFNSKTAAALHEVSQWLIHMVTSDIDVESE